MDAVTLDEVRGQVRGGVRDNRDVLHRTLLPLRKRGRGTATILLTLFARSSWTG